MLDARRPALDPAAGDRLALADYLGDFFRQLALVGGQDCWKLERQQEFLEEDDLSYDAFRKGEWAEALRLMEVQGQGWREEAQEFAQRGSVLRRVRIVEKPIVPYVQWELHLLRGQAAYGMPVRVVSSEAVRSLEPTGPLPELVALGDRVLYQVIYTEQGAVDGALRFTEPERVAEWTQLTAGLYAAGEDVASYVEAHVAHLPPPSAP